MFISNMASKVMIVDFEYKQGIYFYLQQSGGDIKGTYRV